MNGLIIEQSLADPQALKHVQVTKTEFWQSSNAAPYQPVAWTAQSFTVADEQAQAVSEALRLALKPGWYINPSTALHVSVIFPERIFKYIQGDQHQRENAREYGRSLGIPEAQLDWRE